MHIPISVKSPNNTNKWQMGFNSAFKGLNKKGMISHVTGLFRAYNCKLLVQAGMSSDSVMIGPRVKHPINREVCGNSSDFALREWAHTGSGSPSLYAMYTWVLPKE
jgi:hypothetical protein